MTHATTHAHPAPLILASRSASRRAMLEAAGVAFVACPAPVDERAIEAAMGNAGPAQVALALAEAKALAITPPASGGGGGEGVARSLVLGSDSLVEVAGRRFDKPESRQQAGEHLRFFSGKEMHLHSAAALAREGVVIWRHGAMARLMVRPLSPAFIEDYLDHEWPAVGSCAGAFRIEGRGVHLFERIEGDHFTVLGMPLLGVLAGLRAVGAIGR